MTNEQINKAFDETLKAMDLAKLARDWETQRLLAQALELIFRSKMETTETHISLAGKLLTKKETK